MKRIQKKRMSTHAYARTPASDTLAVPAERTHSKLRPIHPDRWQPPFNSRNEVTTAAGKSSSLFTSTSDRNCDTRAPVLSHIPSSGNYLQLPPSPVSLRTPLSTRLHTNISQFHFTWLCSIAEAIRRLWATSAQTEASFEPSCLFTVLYLQHPWPLVLFLCIIFAFLSAQLLMG